MIETAFLNPGAAADVIDADGPEALLPEQIDSGIENLFAGGFMHGREIADLTIQSIPIWRVVINNLYVTVNPLLIEVDKAA